jgi:hypothetical protein
MRLKTYYTLDEITNNLYTAGKEWMFEDGTEYIGMYHRYITRETYTLGKWNPAKSKKLIIYKENAKQDETPNNITTQASTTFYTPTSNTPVIDTTARQQGYIERFFIKKVNELAIKEIDGEQYKMWQQQKIDPHLFTAISLLWKISGNTTDTQQGVVKIPGVQTTNLNTIKRVESQMPGISMYLNDPLQFYTDVDFVAPKDINRLDY